MYQDMTMSEIVEELETSTFDELGQELPPVLMAIDAKLYGALLTAIHHLPTLVMKVTTIVRPGLGRQVVKVIDSEYNFEAAKLAELGNEQLSNGVCKSMAGISDYVARTRLAFQYLDGFPGAMPPEAMVCQNVIKAGSALLVGVGSLKLLVARSTAALNSAKPAESRWLRAAGLRARRFRSHALTLSLSPTYKMRSPVHATPRFTASPSGRWRMRSPCTHAH